MRLLLSPILGQYDASRSPNDRFFLRLYMNAILPIASYTASDPVRLSAETAPFAGEACEINRSLVRTESFWKSRGTALFAAVSQVSTWYLCASGRCVGIRQAMALIGNARQAMSGGKSGPVETGLTGPVATALISSIQALTPLISIETKSFLSGCYHKNKTSCCKILCMDGWQLFAMYLSIFNSTHTQHTVKMSCFNLWRGVWFAHMYGGVMIILYHISNK